MAREPSISEVLFKVETAGIEQYNEVNMPKWMKQLIVNRGTYLFTVLLRGGNIKSEVEGVVRQVMIAAMIAKEEGWID